MQRTAIRLCLLLWGGRWSSSDGALMTSARSSPLLVPRQCRGRIRAAENVCLIGPADTGKSHTWSGSGSPRSGQGTGSGTYPAELVETLYRALADNSVGRVIENVLRNELVLI